jgi:alkaline phosphatase D
MSQQPPLDAWLRKELTRRSLLTGGLALCGLSAARLRGASSVAISPRALRFFPFTLGIASGDPTPDGMVLWTRLAPDPLRGGGMPPVPVEVVWEVADDDQMQRVVRQGVARAVPDWAHSVHVEVAGLKPDRWYWYRFRVGDASSPVGRTRTMPAEGARVDRLRFAFASCQHYETGYFTALRHLAEEDLDLAFHLGDYIYEGRGNETQVRYHTGPEIVTLEHYRNRHAQYRTDRDLQAAHAAFPWVVTWDDHEVDNNYAADLSENNDPRDVFLLRRAAAYQAYYEHMPLRRTSIPAGPSMKIHRELSYGTLASFFVLDTRQYRNDQPCGDRSVPSCEGIRHPHTTLLGDAQERWLLTGLDRSPARWNILPQQIMMASVDLRAGPDIAVSADQWSAYDAARTRLMQFLATRRPANPIVLTGDIHSNWVNDLKVDFRDPKSPVVATEFVGTSITSGGDGIDQPNNAAAVSAENPFVRFRNAQRGYVSCQLDVKKMRADYQIVDYVSRPGAPKKTRASFVVEDGRAGAMLDKASP